MSAVLNSVVGGAGGGGGGTTAESATGLLDSDVETIIEEKNQLISRQYAEIERLQRELREVIGERDALICEVSKFKFEREMTDLKRLHDDSYVFYTTVVSTPLEVKGFDSDFQTANVLAYVLYYCDIRLIFLRLQRSRHVPT
ncbi:IQ motif and SEC7 domain-containing protein 1 isoform X2 [Vespula squamosa]|uniref:IQ motif and SEC7 domain-containing protein 1 isoform X2 n=1 Tax=Vespula squamosa TaxID=30214 RepID=A0ABD2A0J8_VESSQ